MPAPKQRKTAARQANLARFAGRRRLLWVLARPSTYPSLLGTTTAPVKC